MTDSEVGLVFGRPERLIPPLLTVKANTDAFQGNELYLHGRDVSTDMKHKVREFEQHIPIAEDIDRETIHISGFSKGRLVIGARRSSSVSD